MDDKTEQGIIPKVNRRTVIAVTALGVAGLGLKELVNKNQPPKPPENIFLANKQKTQQEQPHVVSKPSASHVLPKVETIPTPEPRDEQVKQLFNQILNLEADTPERKAAEYKYNKWLDQKDGLTVAELDLAYCVIGDKEMRAHMLDLRHELREKGYLPKLPSEKRQWAEKQQIHPEILAICLDGYNTAREYIAGLLKLHPDYFDFDPKTQALIKSGVYRAEDLMINAGGMARLVIFETSGVFRKITDPSTKEVYGVGYGFSYIGKESAYKQINPDINSNPKPGQETQYDKLNQVIDILKKNTGLEFNPTSVLGSTWTKEDQQMLDAQGNRTGSGGAIVAMMPDNIVRINNILSTIGKDFNPLDPTSFVVGAWLFLALKGYLRGDDKRIYGALRHWNPFQPEVNEIKRVAGNYYDTFLAHGKYRY